MVRSFHSCVVLLILLIVPLLRIYAWQAEAFRESRKECIVKRTTVTQIQEKKEMQVMLKLGACVHILLTYFLTKSICLV